MADFLDKKALTLTLIAVAVIGTGLIVVYLDYRKQYDLFIEACIQYRDPDVCMRMWRDGDFRDSTYIR